MRYQPILLLLLLAPFLLGVEFAGQDRSTNRGFIRGIVSDGSTTITATAPVATSECVLSSNLNEFASVEVNKCFVPPGHEWIPLSVYWRITDTLSSSERCQLAISTDVNGVTFEAWSHTDIGDGTTPTCDQSSFTTDLDDEGDWCYQSAPSSISPIPAHGELYVWIAEESVGNCSTIQSISYVIEYIDNIVTFP